MGIMLGSHMLASAAPTVEAHSIEPRQEQIIEILVDSVLEGINSAAAKEFALLTGQIDPIKPSPCDTAVSHFTFA